MGIEIRTVDESESDRWNDLVGRSPHGNPFHRYEALDVQADHADASIHALVGYKGQEPVGTFPVFVVSRGPVRTAFSPPPDLRVCYLGPALVNMEKLKQRKRERRQKRFIDGCFEYVRNEIGPQYVNVRTNGVYTDLRPFKWNDCSVAPSYTYVVDLSVGREELLSTFSSDARSNVRDADDDGYEILEGGAAEIETILDQVAKRYAAQDASFRLTPEFVTDLFERLPEGTLRPYVLEVDGKVVGGLLVVASKDSVYRWLGGVRTDADVDLRVNDLLDWHVMCEAIDEGMTAYDLVGAENPRINEYKAKFDPELYTFYNIEYTRPGMGVLASLYDRVRQRA